MRKFIQTLLFIVVVSGGAYALPKDEITEIKLNVYPADAKIRQNESAVLHAEFFGKKKRGFFESIVGTGEAKTSKLSSNEWKIELLTKNGGILSKRFLFQTEENKIKGGWVGFVSQGYNSISSKDAVLFTAPSKPGKYAVRLTHGSLRKDVTINVTAKNAAPVSEVREFSAPTGTKDKYIRLVENYAPFIAQETWFQPRADYLARFDYDFNWKGDDNWENLEKGSTQAFVYYAVMETDTHWFINYNFFHPRDYSDVCVVGSCHENDFEGLILSIRKDGSAHGRLELLETLAHNNIYSFSNEKSIRKKVHSIDGSIELFDQTHPIVFVEAGGHGIYSSSYRSSLFDSSKMEFKQNTGVTYRYQKGSPDRPAHGNDRDVDYSLISIKDSLWPKGSGETDEANETFENYFVYRPVGNRPLTSTKFIAGAFHGRTASESKAKPFWGWHDRKTRKKRILSTGQWALDPAYSISVCYKWPAELPVSTQYIYNPFLKTAAKP
jgi:hypothetical protein